MGECREDERDSCPRSFILFMRNLSSSPCGQRDECLEFQEYVARSYELRNKIATRVGVRQPTHFGFVGARKTIRWANHLAKPWKSLSVRNVNRTKKESNTKNENRNKMNATDIVIGIANNSIRRDMQSDARTYSWYHGTYYPASFYSRSIG